MGTMMPHLTSFLLVNWSFDPARLGRRAMTWLALTLDSCNSTLRFGNELAIGGRTPPLERIGIYE